MELETTDIEIIAALMRRNAEAGDGLMDFEMLDGFLCGVIVAPTPQPPSVWLPKVLGEQPFADPAQAQQTATSLLKLYNSLVQRLSAVVGEDEEAPLRIYVHRLNPDGTLIERPDEAEWIEQSDSVEPEDEELGEDDELAPVGALWSVGFALATQLAEDEWIQAAEESELVDEIMHLGDLLLPDFPEDEDESEEDERSEHETADDAGPDIDEDDDEDADEELPESDEPLTTEERVIALGELSEALHELYLVNQQRRQPVQTFRRDTPKVGRNDPCPCGSGRKYKHCHGAN